MRNFLCCIAKPSSDTNDDNVSKLSLSVEQLQLQANQVGPRRFFCNDVLRDALPFLRREEHNQVRLASRRLQWLSDKACARYPPREVPMLEVHGVSALPARNPWMPVRPPIVANSMRVYPASGGNPHSVDFPSVEPPEDIVHLSKLTISDFVGPELLQFLRLSARLLGKCWMIFDDFDNFLRHNSTDFTVSFFALFPSKRVIELNRIFSLAAPLFIDHPKMFDCNLLIIEFTDTFSFPLDALQGWLHLDEGKPPKQQMGRHLCVQFGVGIQMDRAVNSAANLVQKLRQRFSNATSYCPFTLDIGLFGGPKIPELKPFIEHSKRTLELLESSRDHDGFYTLKRGRRESTAEREEGDNGEAAETKRTTMVCIRKVVQGDEPPESEDHGEGMAKCRF